MEDQATRLRRLVQNKSDGTGDGSVRFGILSKLNLSVNGSEHRTRVIAITSGKGGVGKTNLAVNLAIALNMERQRTLVIDADLGMANVDIVLGCSSRLHLLNLLEDGITLRDVLMQGPYGVNYISGGSGIEKAQDFSYEERLMLMQKLSECGEIADIVLVDTGAGIGKNVMDFILAADEVILVTTPEPTAMTDAYAVMKAYSMYAAQKNIRLVVNRIYSEEENRDVVEKLQQTSRKFLNMPIDSLGYVFEDRNMMAAVRRQRPVLIESPKSASAKCIKAVASGLLYGTRVEIKQGWRGFLQQIFNFSRK